MSISTLGISRRLKAHGFTESQAEGVAEELVDIVENSDLVTKDFLSANSAGLETRLMATISDIRTEISDVRTEMGELRGELRAEMAGLETKLTAKIGDSKNDTIKWLISLQFGSLALTVGLIYFLLNYFLLKR